MSKIEDLQESSDHYLKLAAEIARENVQLHEALAELLWCAEELQETDSDRFIAAKAKANAALGRTQPAETAA